MYEESIISPAQASMVYTAATVVGVSLMRPIGGWFSDRGNPIRILAYLFGTASIFVVLLVSKISFSIQIASMLCLALLAGAACGFAMSSTMVLSNNFTGSYKYGFLVWAAVNIAALGFAVFPRSFQQREAG